jgi:hypothetical protein
MKLVLYLSAAVLVAVSATWSYKINYTTRDALDRVVALRAQIAAEEEAIAVLEAEWAYLNRPDRLRALIDANSEALELVELTPEQFGETRLVAYPPAPDDVQALLRAIIAASTGGTR